MRAFAATSYQIQDVSMDIRTMSRHAPRRRYGLAAALACGALAGTSATASQLTFQQALERARMDAPSLKARQTQVRAARSAADAADALPDPTLDLSLQNVPVSGPDALSLGADFMTMEPLGLSPDFPNPPQRHAPPAPPQTHNTAPHP